MEKNTATEIHNDQVSGTVKSEKTVKFEERYRELERKIGQKNNVDENQGKSKCKEAESKNGEEHHWEVTSKIIDKTASEVRTPAAEDEGNKQKGELAAASEIDYDDDPATASRDKKTKQWKQ